MKYIIRTCRHSNQVETVDEFDDANEAQVMLHEYRLSDHAGDYRMSSKPTADYEE